jgi:MFS family permease
VTRVAGAWRVLRAVRRNPALWRAEVAYLLYLIVEYATWIAFLLYGYDIAGPDAVGLVSLVMLVPAAITAPLAITIADRYRRDRVLAAGYLGQAVTILLAGLGMVAGAPPVAVFVLAGLSSILMTITRPVIGSLMPVLARTPAELGAANGLMGSLEGVGSLVGPLGAAAALALGSPGLVFVVSGLVIAGGAALLVRMPLPASASVVAPEADDGTEVVAETHRSVLLGMRAVATHRDTRLVVMLLALRTFVTGCLDVLIVLLAMEVLGGGESSVGLLGALVGVGTILGGVAAFALIGAPRLAPAQVANGLAFGVAIALLGAGLPLPAAALCLVVAGLGSGGMDVAGLTVLQRATPNAILARVLGVLTAIDMAALAAGSLLAPVLAGLIGLPSTLFVTGLLVPVAMLLALRGLRAIDARVLVPVREIKLLRRTDVFRPLAAPQLEAVAGRTHWMTAEPGDVLIRQGDVGDRYYILESGRVRIVRDGRDMGLQSEPGDDFGEIALLRNAPRNATVTADASSVLLTLDRADFLEALTGHEQARDVAEQHAAERGGAPVDEGAPAR